MIIKTAIVGTGRIGFMLEGDKFRYHPCTHAGSLQFLNSRTDADYTFQMSAACDLSEERLHEFKRWWKPDSPDVKYYTDYRSLLDNEEIDLLIVSSSFHSHYEISRFALEKQIKAIVLEKPAVKKTEEMEYLLEKSKKKNIPIWINFERRYHNGYREIKKYIDQKILGDLRSINGKILTGPVKQNDEGSPILLDGIHWLDILIWYFGIPDVMDVKIVGSPLPGMYDTVDAYMAYGDVPVFLEAGGRRKYFEFSMEIDFEKGRIRTGNEGQFFYRSALSERYENFFELKMQNDIFIKNNPWTDMYDEIAKHIKNPANGLITSPLSDSLKSLQLYNDIMNHPRRK